MLIFSDGPDVLHALGRSLDHQGASDIEIRFHETFLMVSWHGPHTASNQWTLHETDLESLRAEAEELTLPAGTGRIAQLLRTLGEELNTGDVEANSIVEEPDAFRVSGVSQGRYIQRSYSKAQLQPPSEQQRATRSTCGGTLQARLSALANPSESPAA